MVTPPQVQLKFRVREDLRARLEAAAQAHNRSLNAEITRRLAESLDQVRPDAGMVISEVTGALTALRRLRDRLARERPADALELAAISERLYALQVRVAGIAVQVVDGESGQ